jgi:hypothetical protein
MIEYWEKAINSQQKFNSILYAYIEWRAEQHNHKARAKTRIKRQKEYQYTKTKHPTQTNRRILWEKKTSRQKY